MSAVNQHVLENPTHSGGLWPNYGLRPLWQASAKLLNVFEDPRTRPVQVRPVLKHDKHIGVAEHGLSTHSFHMRSSEQGRNNRIRDLVLNDIWRASRPGRMHNNLHVGDVRQRVKRYPL